MHHSYLAKPDLHGVFLGVFLGVCRVFPRGKCRGFRRGDMRIHTFPRVFYIGKIGFSLPRVFRRGFLGVFLRGHHRHATKTLYRVFLGVFLGVFLRGALQIALPRVFPGVFHGVFPRPPPTFPQGGK